ncbi:MAG: DegT/DnrJ/EryC1/StrS family aminotransferase, partial [Bacteroidia bacterium]|nr:DegT/DnrJ/EryC1/StrS family aminotransferase [Bacteroidia bacterium]
PFLDNGNKERYTYAEKFNTALNTHVNCLPPLIPGSVYHQYSIRVRNRDHFREKMAAEGILTGIHYPYTMRDNPAFKEFCREIPVAEKVVKDFISLPIQPEILDRHFDVVVSKVLSCLKNH